MARAPLTTPATSGGCPCLGAELCWELHGLQELLLFVQEARVLVGGHAAQSWRRGGQGSVGSGPDMENGCAISECHMVYLEGRVGYKRPRIAATDDIMLCGT